MLFITRKIILETLSHHQSLTLNDIRSEENLGFIPDPFQLTFLLRQLIIKEQVRVVSGVSPVTYAITGKGMEERTRLYQ